MDQVSKVRQLQNEVLTLRTEIADCYGLLLKQEYKNYVKNMSNTEITIPSRLLNVKIDEPEVIDISEHYPIVQYESQLEKINEKTDKLMRLKLIHKKSL